MNMIIPGKSNTQVVPSFPIGRINDIDNRVKVLEQSGGAGISDGDKGDITVSGSGVTWTIDNSAVSLAKMADVATSTVFYRKTASTGTPEVQTLATLKTDLGLTGTNSGDQTISLTGEATGSGNGSFAVTLTNSSVIGKVLTGLSLVTSQVISATDTVLQAFGYLQAQITALTTTVSGKVVSTRTINTTAPLSGGGDLSSDRTLTTSMSSGKLIGRGTAGTGVFEEITLGTNLSLSGTTLNASGGGGSSATKGIVEVDFGSSATQSDIATVSVVDATVTSTSYPSVSMYALATTDHDPDDYMVESLIPFVTNVQNGVGFDISVRAPELTWGKYKCTYQF